MRAARLTIRSLCKSFSAPVLRNVDLVIRVGEVHGLVGENGAGKSTIVNILAGLLQKDSGQLILDGADYDPMNASDGIAAGISCATQELSVIGTLSLAENIGLKRLPHKYSVISRDRLNHEARRLLRLVGLEGTSPEKLAEVLSLADRQLLELAKALSIQCRLLILDEPTAALTKSQADRLHKVITGIAATGTSVIYISHRLEDVRRVSDTVSILRDGQVVKTVPTRELSVPGMIEQMIGRRRQGVDVPPVSGSGNRAAINVKNVTTDDLPNAINCTFFEGEIVGIAGLAGSGRSEFLQALFGLVPITSGTISRCTVDGDIPIRSPGHAVRLGMGYLTEDRKSTGILSGQSVLTNMTLPGMSKIASLSGIIDRALENAAGNELVNKLEIKCRDLHQDIRQLSGGNQQKALIARWLHCDSQILLLDEPTRGVDVGTKHTIYALLFDMQRRNKMILVASSEIEELMTLCSRIIVLSNRRLIRVFERGEWSESDILAAAFKGYTVEPRSGVRG